MTIDVAAIVALLGDITDSTAAIDAKTEAIAALLNPPSPPPTPPVPATRLINPAGEALIKEWEGLVMTAEQDIAGVLTIGWGHTGSDVYPGLTITQDRAQQLLDNDLVEFEDFVGLHATKVPTDNQFSAMVSLAFNIGNGGISPKTGLANGFLGSTVLRQHNLGNFQAAADAFMLWDKAHVDGQLVTVAGLHNRREAESALYLTS